jgi:hypothetical protein
MSILNLPSRYFHQIPNFFMKVINKENSKRSGCRNIPWEPYILSAHYAWKFLVISLQSQTFSDPIADPNLMNNRIYCINSHFSRRSIWHKTDSSCFIRIINPVLREKFLFLIPYLWKRPYFCTILFSNKGKIQCYYAHWYFSRWNFPTMSRRGESEKEKNDESNIYFVKKRTNQKTE